MNSLNLAAHGTPEEKLGRAFKLYDLNNDGSINKSEAILVIGVRISYCEKMLILYGYLKNQINIYS